MNYMEQVAHMLGVDLEQEFYVKGRSEKYKFNKNGLYLFDEDRQTWLTDFSLMRVLNGQYEIIERPILDEAEREYLDAVVKPFRNKVISITKLDSEEMNGYEYICIEHREVCNERYFINLPCFKKGTIYKGMETDKAYSMEDLGL